MSALQSRQGRAACVTVAPRPWQAAFLAQHAAAEARDFLLVATPGSGKTLAACHAIRAADCEQVVVVCPTTALRAQWADAADRVGLHLDPRWRNADGAWRADVDGVVVTYQQVASAPDLFAHHLARSTFVVLDEIHHAGESATWGTALRAAFDGARRRLGLSGTPFRSDARAIPFVALRRRPPLRARLRLRLRRGGRRRGLPSAGLPAARRHAALASRCAGDDRRVRRRARPDDDARRLRTAIDPMTPLLPQMLRDADALLVKGARRDPRRRRPAAVRRPGARARECGVAADDRGGEAGRGGQRRARRTRRIERFARGGADAARWLVAVNMVSEGVDVPRLVVAAYATVKRTDLFFRQAVGRVVRRRPEDPDDLVATVFLPADPALTGCAERVEVELRQQVSDEIGAAFEVEPPPGLARSTDFQPLDAQVQPGGMIVAGIHYRREEVDAARRLLRELGQSERALRSVLEFVRRERVGWNRRRRARGAAGSRPPSCRGQARRARSPRAPLGGAAPRDRSGVQVAAGPGARQPRDGRRRRSEAGEAQLDDGLAFLRAELDKLARTTPNTPSGCAFRPASKRSTGVWRR